MLWLLVLACTGSPDGPATDCASLAPPLRAECVLTSIEDNPDPALCALVEGDAASECHFRIAENTDDPAFCKKAGPHEDSCRLHIYSQRLPSWLPAEASLVEVAALAPEKMEAVGLSSQDPRPWSATWRTVLAAHRPLDRSSCQPLQSTLQKAACLHTGIALFHDQLTRAASLGTDLCTGPLPPSLAHAPDPDLENALKRRRENDLCEPSLLLPPPADPR